MSPGRKDPPEAKRTVKEWADFACNTNPKAKCRSQWNGDEISFCHWEAESAQDILDWFDEIGLKDYMSIELHEQWTHRCLMHRHPMNYRRFQLNC